MASSSGISGEAGTSSEFRSLGRSRRVELSVSLETTDPSFLVVDGSLWFPVEGALLAQFVEGNQGDYSSSIPTNYEGELYDTSDEEEDDDSEDEDDEPGSSSAARKEAKEKALEEINESHGGLYGLMLGRVLFGKL